MALSQRIKVVFERVDVRKATALWGPSEWSFAASVGGATVGDSATTFPMEGKAPATLPEGDWSTIVEVGTLDAVEIDFSAKAVRDIDVEDLGRVKWKMRFPFSAKTQLLSNKFFLVTLRIELEVGGVFGPHGGNEVFACRTIAGRPVWTTVSGRRFVARLEFCEVRPTPGDAELPPRPVQPAGVAGPKRNGSGRPGIRPTDPINYIHNPSVIPILDPVSADENTAATVEYTYYRPSSLAFADADPRLVWSSKSLADSGAVAFVGRPEGLKVHVYGTHEGEVLLECSMEGMVLASYRALVRRIRDVVCRFNILNGPPGAIPRSTPDDIVDHMKIANILLRQAGLQLVLDTDATVSDGAAATAIGGIFRIKVNAGVTSGIALSNFPRCSRLNYRRGVMNFAYIQSAVPLGPGAFVLGMATDIPANVLAPSVADSGTPSTSWKQPSGLAPDKAAKTVTMKMFRQQQRSAYQQLFAMYITDNNGSPSSATDQLTYANTIAHELGHVLGLRHRVGAGDDGLLHPWNQNLMHGTNPGTIAQDLDLIQARAVIGSPAVT